MGTDLIPLRLGVIARTGRARLASLGGALSDQVAQSHAAPSCSTRNRPTRPDDELRRSHASAHTRST